MSTPKIETGSRQADDRYSITVSEKGPYLVYGRPPLATQFIMLNAEYESWYFLPGRHFPTASEPTALCRCGQSANKPYCDGTHASIKWQDHLDAAPEETSEPLTEREAVPVP